MPQVAIATLITIGFHESFEDHKWLYAGSGFALLVLSAAGVIVFKGKLFMAFVSRILVGGLFIVSGLIKANDPSGFAYKLEEYFEDGALAFRIKEAFGMPDFSLEFLIPWALTFSIIICVVDSMASAIKAYEFPKNPASALMIARNTFPKILKYVVRMAVCSLLMDEAPFLCCS